MLNCMNNVFFKGRKFVLIFSRCRSLSAHETSIALRPFIFRVHPDLFIKYGEEKAKINEDSLKQLNEHIHKLQNKEQATPVNLIFYLRPVEEKVDKQSESPQMIKLFLNSKDVTETIKSILKSCRLSLDYLESIGISSHTVSTATTKTNVNTDWVRSGMDWWYKMKRGGKERESGFEIYRNFRQQNVISWLKQNIKKAKKNNIEIQHVVEEVIKMKLKLKENFGIKNIEWRNGWMARTRPLALYNLFNVCNVVKNDVSLKGLSIIFSNSYGVAVDKSILLTQDTVPDSWKHILRSISEVEPVFDLIPIYEKKLSKFLGGVKIFPPQHSLILADNYLEQLKQLERKLLGYQIKTREKLENFNDIKISFECTTGPILLKESGLIMIPSSCPPFLIFEFILKNYEKSRKLNIDFKRSKLSDESLINLCHSMLKLKNLTQDSSITRCQMVTCCKRLIKLMDSGKLDLDLSSLSLKIAQHYTVDGDGEMSIPWNFEI